MSPTSKVSEPAAASVLCAREVIRFASIDYVGNSAPGRPCGKSRSRFRPSPCAIKLASEEKLGINGVGLAWPGSSFIVAPTRFPTIARTSRRPPTPPDALPPQEPGSEVQTHSRRHHNPTSFTEA